VHDKAPMSTSESKESEHGDIPKPTRFHAPAENSIFIQRKWRFHKWIDRWCIISDIWSGGALVRKMAICVN
jgi:hypothetical protein